MADSTTTLTLVVDAKNNADGALKSVQTSVAGLQSKMQSLKPAFQQAGVIAGVAFGAITLAVKDALEASAEAAKVQAQLGAVLKSTGGIAGVTAQKAIELSKALQKQTTYGDEAILSAENMLLTFTNIKDDIFPDATKIVLDMSTALGTDLKSSAIQLGKALQDPILGVSALRRVGVNFSKDQQEVIKSLVETGRSAEAQAMIMKELTKEFGGSASAAAQTFAGRMTQLNEQIGDVKESIGNALIPVITDLLTKITPIVEKTGEWIEKNPELVKQIIIIAGAATGVVALVSAIGLVLIALNPVAIVIGGILITLGLIGKIIWDISANWGIIWAQMKRDMEPVINYLDKVKEGFGIVTNVSKYKENAGYLIKGILGSKAEGGYIPQTGPYLMHKGEFVTKADGSNAAGPSFQFIFNGDVNDRDALQKSIIDSLNRSATLRQIGAR